MLLSYADLIAYAKRQTAVIRSIRAGGYRAARKYTAFYSRARWQDSEARRAVASVQCLGNPAPYFFRDGILWGIDLSTTIKNRKAAYMPLRGYEAGDLARSSNMTLPA